MRRRVGFIGLGTMGRPMAGNLVRAGHELRVFDLSPKAVEALTGLGAGAAASPRDAAIGAEVVITMLPGSGDVIRAVLGEDGAIHGLEAGATLIDMSTIDPATSRRVAEQVTARGARMLDAPVSGSSWGATEGTLTIMAGGDAGTLDEHRELLQAMGSNIIHCGALGMGGTVKLANNVVAGVSMLAVAEAFALGVRAGADPAVMFEVMSKSSGNCWALQTRCPVPGVLPDSPASHDFAPGFMVDLMHKDLGLALTSGGELKVPMAATALARELYALASSRGLGRKDYSAVATLLQAGER